MSSLGAVNQNSGVTAHGHGESVELESDSEGMGRSIHGEPGSSDEYLDGPSTAGPEFDPRTFQSVPTTAKGEGYDGGFERGVQRAYVVVRKRPPQVETEPRDKPRNPDDPINKTPPPDEGKEPVNPGKPQVPGIEPNAPDPDEGDREA